MLKKVKVTLLDIEEGRPEITLTEADAEELGLHVKDRVRLKSDGKIAVGIVNIASKDLEPGTVLVSHEISELCRLESGQTVELAPARKPSSVAFIKKKMDKETLSKDEFLAIVKDVLENRLSETEIAAFIAALYINEMTMDETEALTRTLAETGEIINFEKRGIFDKHSIGGVPGNKVTLLIVPIVAAAGLTIPKTSSRAITSASGTADTMEVLAPVTFNAEKIVEIVNHVNGIICWGGGVNLAPADDLFIKVEHPLALDPHNLALCSVMAKKIATGTKFLVIDLPMGNGTKIKNIDEAEKYAIDFIELGKRIGIKTECLVTYGDKPVGRAVGPVLEAQEALRALEGEGPSSLIEKSTGIAGVLLEAGGIARKGEGKKKALKLLKSGAALKKMKEIIAAQGGDPNVTSNDLKPGRYKAQIKAESDGYIVGVHNKAVVDIARAAGAPRDKGAGLLLLKSKGYSVHAGDILFEVYSDSKYKLDEAVKLARQHSPIAIEGMLIERIPSYSVLETSKE
ncbi:pyrimidine-nucleoside phosphorylase [archaeon BMS3Abin16]|nr:pyrimidine-nucleoside phosphorylase [archaeon BMS3Abin16]HDY74806.1 AMP phosphorylase [Euryarchaeota archaeon]